MLQNNYQPESDLATIQDRAQMVKSGAWQDFRVMVTEWVAEAYENMMNAKYGMPEVRAGHLTHYQNRVELMRRIDQWSQSADQELKEITEAMRQDLERASQEPSYV